MTTPTDSHVLVPGDFPLANLRPGDRIPRSRTYVEVDGLITIGTDDYLRLRSVKTGVVHAKALRAAGSVRGALLAPRPDAVDRLTLGFFVGGFRGSTAWPALAVPLTHGGRALLCPSFVLPGSKGPDGATIQAPTFGRLEVYLPSAGITGVLGLFGPRSHQLWGYQHWDTAAQRLRVLGALDGGLSRAGQALLDAFEGHHLADEASLWALVVAVAAGVALTAEELALLVRLAPDFHGSLTDLTVAARGILTSAS